MPRKVIKNAFIKFYEEDEELYREIRKQAVDEDTSLREITLKSIRFYLDAIKTNKDNNKLQEA